MSYYSAPYSGDTSKAEVDISRAMENLKSIKNGLLQPQGDPVSLEPVLLLPKDLQEKFEVDSDDHTTLPTVAKNATRKLQRTLLI